MAGHASPLVEGLTKALNIDLYRSARDQQLQHVDPNDAWTPALLAQSLIALTPLSQFGTAAEMAGRSGAQQQIQATQPQGQQQTWQDQYKAWAQGLPLPPGWRAMIVIGDTPSLPLRQSALLTKVAARLRAATATITPGPGLKMALARSR